MNRDLFRVDRIGFKSEHRRDADVLGSHLAYDPDVSVPTKRFRKLQHPAKVLEKDCASARRLQAQRSALDQIITVAQRSPVQYREFVTGVADTRSSEADTHSCEG